MLRRIKIDKDIERKITIAFIISEPFIKRIRSSYRPEYIELDYARKIIDWCLQYHDQYHQPPNLHITDIYDVEKEELKEEECSILETFLESISDEYENSATLNIDLRVNQAKDYFRRRSLEILFEKGEKYTKSGRIEDAEKLLLKHQQVAKVTSGRYKPFDIQRVRQHRHRMLENILFKMPGALGELTREFCRGFLVAVQAPEKRGKSWFLEEIVFQALLARLKVFWISLEMSEAIMDNRIYQRLTGCDKISRDCEYPVLDCLSNQDDTCSLKVKPVLNKEGILDDDGKKPKFKSGMKYKVCTHCKDDPKLRRHYLPAYWYKEMKTKEMKTKIMEEKVEKFTGMFGDNLWVKTFPRFDASMNDIINELDDLIYSDEVELDVLVVDYLDITSSGYGTPDGRDRYDYAWKLAAQIAGKKNCLVVTADQADAAGRKKRSLDDSSFSEDKRKDGHLDRKIVINQTKKEKSEKVARISVTFDRHEYFHPDREVLILQELSLGQPVLNSVWWSKHFEK